MDRLTRELLEALKELRRNADGSIEALFCPGPACIAFAGHFPENPILPAVAQVQMGLAAICRASQEHAATLPRFSMPTAKFTKPVLPDQGVTVLCRPSQQQAGRWQVLCTVNDAQVSSFTLDIVPA